MDPPLVNEASFSTANPSSYSLAELWPFQVNGSTGAGADGISGERGLGLKIGGLGECTSNRDVSIDESTVTEQSGSRGKRREAASEDESSKLVSTSSGSDMYNLNSKRMKVAEFRNEICGSKGESDFRADRKGAEEAKLSELPKQDYIHVRARRGQATDSHSLAERARREKISERMKILQDLVPGCNKVIGKASVLDEIINYIQSLQRQVEFLSMKLETVNARVGPAIEAFPAKDLAPQTFDASGMLYGSHTTREYGQDSHPEWLHMQVGGSFDRAT